MSKNYDESFNNCINELQKIYSNNPELANKKAHNLLQELKNNGSVWNDILEKSEPIMIVLACLIIFITGLLNINTFAGYLFGFIFFIAGLFVGLKVKGFGLIFLFSHGMTGLAAMIMALISNTPNEFDFDNLMENPLLQDYASGTKTFLTIVIALIIIGILSVCVYNISDTFKKKKYSIYIPIAIFEIVLLMTAFVYDLIPLL